MKTRTLFLLFNLALAVALPAQDYEPLVKEGSTWQMVRYGNAGFDNFYYGNRIGGDTLLQGQQYHKLYSLSLLEGDFPTGDCVVEEERLIGALREDTASRQVFFLSFVSSPGFSSRCDPGAEQLMLDFNYAVGDTLYGLCSTPEGLEDDPEGSPCVVDSVYTAFIWGKERRVIRCPGDPQWGFNEYLIEGVGFSQGLFNFGAHYYWNALIVNSLHRYCAPDIAESCDLLTSTREPPAVEGGLLLYPNPAQDVARLSWRGIAPAAEGQAVLRDATGREVLRAPLRLSAGQAELSVQGLPAGWYSLFVEAGGERRVARLVIVR